MDILPVHIIQCIHFPLHLFLKRCFLLCWISHPKDMSSPACEPFQHVIQRLKSKSLELQRKWKLYLELKWFLLHNTEHQLLSANTKAWLRSFITSVWEHLHVPTSKGGEDKQISDIRVALRLSGILRKCGPQGSLFEKPWFTTTEMTIRSWKEALNCMSTGGVIMRHQWLPVCEVKQQWSSLCPGHYGRPKCVSLFLTSEWGCHCKSGH